MENKNITHYRRMWNVNHRPLHRIAVARKSNDSIDCFRNEWIVSPIFSNGILFAIHFVFNQLRTLRADILIVSWLNKLPAKIVSHWMLERNVVHATHFRCCRVSIIAIVFMKKKHNFHKVSSHFVAVNGVGAYVTITISDSKYWCNAFKYKRPVLQRNGTKWKMKNIALRLSAALSEYDCSFCSVAQLTFVRTRFRAFSRW